MKNKGTSDFQMALESFAESVKEKFSLPISFNPEDQLKEPVATMLKAAGTAIGQDVNAVTEVHAEEDVGRPDVGVTVKSLLAGYVELKAPGKGADPTKFKGADKRQWERFQNLPNLIYTDGNEWALYRDGERVGKFVRFSGDVISDGTTAVSSSDAGAVLGLVRDFLSWEPIVPTNPRALAKMLAPICRLLRSDVLTALENPNSNLSKAAADWRKYLFHDADNKQFADAYAQTLTYALLLAQLSGANDLAVSQAAKTIRTGHRLLADALKFLGDDNAREEISVPANLLQRIIAAVDPVALAKKANGDPWLYFYEDFLAEYDPQMRKDRGVYYTPVPVVQTQVRLVAELLTNRFDAEFSFVDPKVLTLDPAAGTGTYILAAIAHGLDKVADEKGPGMRTSAATTAATNVHAFEILVGPYAVAHLRLTQQIEQETGKLPADGVHVYLTDTLESPHEQPPQYPFLYKEFGEEHKRAQKVKAKTPVLVCIGNPPYDRQQISEGNGQCERRKGGWVRFGEKGEKGSPIIRDFINPLTDLGWGVHAKNLYNDYVYFWRWALWKVFEAKAGSGIVSFITASSYLRGRGFAGMRKVMRQTFDELWIIDLEGDNLGARKTENVFAIRTPVAIAIGVRYADSQPDKPAAVHYTRIEGTEKEKLSQLEAIIGFKDLPWRDCREGWTHPFLPISDKAYWDWPLLTDLFPWQENGMQFKRPWPIAESLDVLQRRWATLLDAPKSRRGTLLKETEARRANGKYSTIEQGGGTLPPLTDLKPGTPPVTPTRYAYRSFDRQWALADVRLCDRPRPTLYRAHSDRQVYMTSLLTKVLGEGPAAVGTSLIPDLDHFCNRGARDVIPLWRNAEGTDANVTAGVLDVVTKTCGHTVTAEDFFAYCYAVLATPQYVRRFWDELTIPGPRIPVTKDAALFAQAVALGRQLLWLHTYGERFVPFGGKPGKVPPGLARCKVGTPSTQGDYPEVFSYDAAAQALHVGKGVFSNVRHEVWNFSVSGLEVVKSWLGYRMLHRAGKKSSLLDDIRPEVWRFDEELLDLLWVLDATVDMLPQVTQILDAILVSPLFMASDFPQPTESEQQGPKGMSSQDAPLFEFAGIDIESEDEN